MHDAAVSAQERFVELLRQRHPGYDQDHQGFGPSVGPPLGQKRMFY